MTKGITFSFLVHSHHYTVKGLLFF